MSRSRLRWAAVVTGLLLIIGLRLAPFLPPALIAPVSVLWLLLLAFLALAAHRVLATWLGSRAAAVLLLLAGVIPMLATSVRPGPALDPRLPCPRNWTSPATWMLRSSPMGITRLTLDGALVRICYSRPAARGRTMLGGPRVPYGQLWRTGANEPTTITTATAITVAGIPVESGRAALYTIPGPETWEIILTGSTSQWGVESEYSAEVQARELGRSIVPSERTESYVERMIIRPETGGVVLEWEHTRVRIRIEAGGTHSADAKGQGRNGAMGPGRTVRRRLLSGI